MRGIARLADRTVGNCSEHGPNIGGTITTASSNHFTNSLGTARLSDTVKADCGCTAMIITACPTVLVNDLGAARLSDLVQGPTYTAKIVTASSDTFGEP
jgi:uncharacterized Zn-binding protein involved in type VI secretion